MRKAENAELIVHESFESLLITVKNFKGLSMSSWGLRYRRPPSSSHCSETLFKMAFRQIRQQVRRVRHAMQRTPKGAPCKSRLRAHLPRVAATNVRSLMFADAVRSQFPFLALLQEALWIVVAPKMALATSILDVFRRIFAEIKIILLVPEMMEQMKNGGRPFYIARESLWRRVEEWLVA